MLLGVNIDHVATLRNARGGFEPDPIQAAHICEENGATSITAHLREDRRHIKDQDVRTLKKVLKVNLNLEMAVTDEMQAIALEVLPHSVCLVPEKRQEVTTEGGLDVAGQLERVTKFVKPLVDAGIQVSLFIDPDLDQIKAAAKTGAQFIEMHTGQYSLAFGTEQEKFEFEKLKNSASLAQELGLKVNAGHGLNYENVSRMHEIDGLYELNIGHSIISKAVFTGLAQAVRDMADLSK
ncbi:pyridoxine 5'-phosphate synthase [bacterium]|nr:pyridoxine 5'-phosphate synthase [bacterium]